MQTTRTACRTPWHQIKSPALRLLLFLLAALTSGTVAHAEGVTHAASAPAAAGKSGVIPWSEIGAKAGAQYSGEGLSVTDTERGARLKCVFQKLEGEATSEGLWLTSTVTNQPQNRFKVKAAAVGRAGSPLPAAGGASVPASRLVSSLAPPEDTGAHGVTRPTTLPETGDVSIDGQTVRFTRPGLVEEYSVSMDGVRQDFVVLDKPGGDGEVKVQLSVTGAKVEPTPYGAQLALAQSGRKIAYSRLKAVDANGKELPARMEVVKSEIRNSKSEMGLAVLVDDAEAVYPLRIDPTFSDANWVSMGGLPGADGDVSAAVVDGSGNLYIGGSFTAVGDVFAPTSPNGTGAVGARWARG